MALVDEQRARRAELVVERTDAAKALAEVQLQKAAVDGERKAVEADLGPVRYLATVIGTRDDENDVLVYPRGGVAAGSGGGVTVADGNFAPVITAGA
jgi:hypothetical protein